MQLAAASSIDVCGSTPRKKDRVGSSSYLGDGLGAMNVKDELFPRHSLSEPASASQVVVNGVTIPLWTYGQLSSLSPSALQRRVDSLCDALGKDNCPARPTRHAEDLVRWILRVQAELTQDFKAWAGPSMTKEDRIPKSLTGEIEKELTGDLRQGQRYQDIRVLTGPSMAKADGSAKDVDRDFRGEHISGEARQNRRHQEVQTEMESEYCRRPDNDCMRQEWGSSRRPDFDGRIMPGVDTRWADMASKKMSDGKTAAVDLLNSAAGCPSASPRWDGRMQDGRMHKKYIGCPDHLMAQKHGQELPDVRKGLRYIGCSDHLMEQKIDERRHQEAIDAGEGCCLIPSPREGSCLPDLGSPTGQQRSMRRIIPVKEHVFGANVTDVGFNRSRRLRERKHFDDFGSNPNAENSPRQQVEYVPSGRRGCREPLVSVR